MRSRVAIRAAAVDGDCEHVWCVAGTLVLCSIRDGRRAGGHPCRGMTFGVHSVTRPLAAVSAPYAVICSVHWNTSDGQIRTPDCAVVFGKVLTDFDGRNTLRASCAVWPMIMYPGGDGFDRQHVVDLEFNSLARRCRASRMRPMKRGRSPIFCNRRSPGGVIMKQERYMRLSRKIEENDWKRILRCFRRYRSTHRCPRSETKPVGTKQRRFEVVGMITLELLRQGTGSDAALISRK